VDHTTQVPTSIRPAPPRLKPARFRRRPRQPRHPLLENRPPTQRSPSSEVSPATATPAQAGPMASWVHEKRHQGRCTGRARPWFFQAVEPFRRRVHPTRRVDAEPASPIRVTHPRNPRPADLTVFPKPGVPVPATPSILLPKDLAPADTALPGSPTSFGLLAVCPTTMGRGSDQPTPRITSPPTRLPCGGSAREGLEAVDHRHHGCSSSGTRTPHRQPLPAAAADQCVSRKLGRTPTPPLSGTRPPPDGQTPSRSVSERPGRGAPAPPVKTPARGAAAFRTELCFPEPRRRTHCRLRPKSTAESSTRSARPTRWGLSGTLDDRFGTSR